MKLVAVQDTVAKAFLSPITVRTTQEGLRVFETAVKNPDHSFHKNPSDFVLFELAEFDETTGVIKPYDKHILLSTASQHLQ